jgi:hypothetical protein
MNNISKKNNDFQPHCCWKMEQTHVWLYS